MPGNSLQDTAIRLATPVDAASISAIYNHYVLNTVVTFEEAVVSASDMAARIAEVQAAALPWLVAARDDGVLGYAYATPWKGRCAYRFTVEVTVYLDPELSRRGIGSELYRHILPKLAHLRYHAVIGGIALPNEASVALHEKFGFRKVAHFHEVGFKLDRWIDVGYWQRTL